MHAAQDRMVKCEYSLCTPSGVHCRLFRWFLGKCFLLVASASLHDWFLHFLESVNTIIVTKGNYYIIIIKSCIDTDKFQATRVWTSFQ